MPMMSKFWMTKLYTKSLPWISPRAALVRVPAGRGTVLLESVRGGQYSILAWQPIKIIKTLKTLERAQTALPKMQTQLPFAGGLIGLLPYELGADFESIPRPARDISELPELWFGLFDGGLIFDHKEKKLTAVAWSADRLREMNAQLQHPALPIRALQESRMILKSNFTKTKYCAAVRKIQKLIRDGFTFQVNLSQRFAARVGDIDPVQLYDRLCRANPAPFAGYLDAGSFQVISSSPELLFKTTGRQIETWPIAGTRPRGATTATDRELAHELRDSEKEQAEHVMLVDLLRNDLGRVSELGSVQVDRLARVEKYARVQHLVSRISGELRQGVSFAEILRAMHPGGTITGCPKVETMKIISQLEDATRGVYTGALGYVSAHGDTQFSILIRTLTLQPSELSFQAGGGVVADSDPAAEYAETLDKAAALFEAVLK